MIKDKRNDWVIDAENTYTQCNPSSNGDKVDCANGINLRWKRNFETEDGSADAQLSESDADKSRPAFSFVLTYDDSVSTETPSSQTLNWYPTSVTITPVTAKGVEESLAEVVVDDQKQEEQVTEQ